MSASTKKVDGLIPVETPQLQSIANPQQVLPLAKVALKAHAFGDLEA
jgi:hypothetical protein